jgi:hypothetical protein
MAKVTEKSLKARCTELNLGPLKTTTFGVRATRTMRGYTVDLQYRDATPPVVIINDCSAAEAAAAVEAVAAGAAAVKVAGVEKPEYATRETFVRQAGERCPKCSTKDLLTGHLGVHKGMITQSCSCQRCGTVWNAIFRLDDYEVAVPVAPAPAE